MPQVERVSTQRLAQVVGSLVELDCNIGASPNRNIRALQTHRAPKHHYSHIATLSKRQMAACAGACASMALLGMRFLEAMPLHFQVKWTGAFGALCSVGGMAALQDDRLTAHADARSAADGS